MNDNNEWTEDTKAFLELPREERIKNFLNFLGVEYNKVVEDCMALASESFENQTNLETFRFMLETQRDEYGEMTKYLVGRFNEVCDDVHIYSIKIEDVDIDKCTCRVVPVLELIDD